MVAGHKTSVAGRDRKVILIYSLVRVCHFDRLFDLCCRSNPKSRSSHRNPRLILLNHLHRPYCSSGCWLAASGSSTAGAGQVDWLHFFCLRMAATSSLMSASSLCYWCLDLSSFSHLGFHQRLYFAHQVQRPLNCFHQIKYNFSCTFIGLTPTMGYLQPLITVPRCC